MSVCIYHKKKSKIKTADASLSTAGDEVCSNFSLFWMCVPQSQTSPQGTSVPHRDKNLLLKGSGVLFKDSLTRQNFMQAFKYASHNLPSILMVHCEFDDLWTAKTENSCGLCAHTLFCWRMRLLGLRSAVDFEALTPACLSIDWMSVTKVRQ